MSLQVADGSVTITTAAVNTTFTATCTAADGRTFVPKAVFLFWSGRTTTGQGEARSKFGFGFFTATNSRRCTTTQSAHNSAAAATDHLWYNDACIATLDAAGALDGKADIDALTSDGFRLIIDDTFASDLIVGWIAWGGEDITDVAIVDFNEPLSSGTQDINVGFALNTGIDDKAVIFLHQEDEASGTPDTASSFCFGVAAGDTPANALLAGNSSDGSDPTDSVSYCRSGECVAHVDFGPTNVYSRGGVSVWLSTGFRINWTEVGGLALGWSALVIKGGRWFVGDSVTSTGTSNQVEATPYTPKGLLFGSHGKAASSADTPQDVDERIIGVATGPASRRCAAMLDKDNAATTDVGIAYREDCFYINQSTAGTIAVEGLADLVSFDTTPGFTFVMDDADPGAAFFFYLGCADAPKWPQAQYTTYRHDTYINR